MKLLVIGSGGFIGQSVYRHFTSSYEVMGCDVFETKQDDFLLIGPHSFDSIFRDYDVDVCINCSGNGSVPISIEKPDLDYALNTQNVFHILEAIRTYNPSVKFINLSSAAVYGNPKSLPITEEHEINPLSPYGWHKYQSEVLIQEYAQLNDIKGVSLRVFSVYGEGLRKQLFWDTYQKYLQNQKEVLLFGDGTESRDFIYIQDLCLAIDNIISHADFDGRVMNVASGIEITIKEAVALFLFYIDSNCALRFNHQTKPGDPKNWRADITRLKALGFVPRYSFQESIQRVVAWVQQEKK